MKISFCLIVHNEARTLRANLDHLYPHAHQIIVCEGAITLLRHQLDLSARSGDGTNDILDEYPDPERKLLVIRRDWETKDEMAAAYAVHATGDLIWHVDADEFYEEDCFGFVRGEFQDDPALDTLEIPHRIFWKSPRHVLVDADGNDRWCLVPRVLRRAPGMSVSHIPVRRIINGKPDESNRRPPREARIVCWHYGWNDDARVRAKLRIYSTRDQKTTRPGWIDSVWDRWTPDQPDEAWPDGVHPAKAVRAWPRPFTRPHPRCIAPILNRLDVLRHGGFTPSFSPEPSTSSGRTSSGLRSGHS